MPVQVSWTVPKQIMMVEASGTLTKEELRQMDAQLIEYLRSAAPSSVHLIGIIAQLKSVPPLTEMLRLQGKNEPNMGWIVVVGQRSAVNRTLIDLFARLTNRQIRNVPTLEEAMKFLEAQRESS
jgi:hypothetical protein